jgi:endonuclease YncB( thermonuclease family)
VSWTVPATVTGVHDGDTIRVTADLGWHVKIDTLVRIDGIDAPELETPAGKVARDFLATLLPAGTPVTVVSKQLLGSREKYGRVLADVTFLPHGPGIHALSVAGEMVATGHAVVWAGRGPKPAGA